MHRASSDLVTRAASAGVLRVHRHADRDRPGVRLVRAGRSSALIVLVATAGKFGGTFARGPAGGLDWRQAAGLGVLMNTRGLMELIVLNVGLELGVISPTLFTMLVLMALVTTLATTPILRRLIPA